MNTNPTVTPPLSFADTLAAYEQAGHALRDAANTLPAAPPPGAPCPACGRTGTWQIIEPGYGRWTTIDIEGEHGDPDTVYHATTDGWDDYSEHGTAERLECSPYRTANGDNPSTGSHGCGATYRLPDTVEWD